MSYNFKEKYEDEFDREHKSNFLDFIVRVEALVEKAIDFGAEGDPRMLDIILSLQNIDKEVTDQADFANESRPPVYYAVKLTNIVEGYFPTVIENEILRINAGIKSEGLNEFWDFEIRNLESKVYYFKELYPDLEIDALVLKLKELVSR
jgi:hypothetical protein